MNSDAIRAPRGVRDRLRGALPTAMRARDRPAVSALRSALAAIDNAEAVDPADVPEPDRGSTVGHSGDVARRSLSEEHMRDLVRAEIADRHTAADGYARAGHHSRAERLWTEADVLAAHLDDADPPAG